MNLLSNGDWLSNLTGPLILTGSCIAALLLLFIALFFVPGTAYWLRLRLILRRMNRFGPNTPPSEFALLFAKDIRLAHLWNEYEETLHSQEQVRDGVMEIVAVRSTIPSETFFNIQYVIDSRLRTEFFKHFPGIFTGLGIIGTFSGLVTGLQGFKVSEDPSLVRESLELLMSAVGEAFLVSAAAITIAMLTTILEKLLLASLYRRTEEITHRIDANFDSGAGEEYLSRLVNASEASASQAKILKDALVQELGDILKQLTDAQLNAAREDRAALASNIASSIETSLRAPLEDIANVVKSATRDQSASAVELLKDVMVSFSQQLSDLFGGQIRGINELSNKSAETMQQAVSALTHLIGALEESGKQSTNDMASQMAASIKAMEERQASINSQTEMFVEQIRSLVSSSQSETQQKLQETLGSVAQQMGSILTSLGESQAKVLNENRAREEAMTDRAVGFVGEMTKNVEAAITEMTAASRSIVHSVAALSSATTSTIDKMNVGALRLENAATSFAQAGERVTSAMNLAATVGEKLTSLAGQLTTSSAALQEVLRDYQSQRQAVATLLSEVKGIVELARKEASVTTDVLQRIENSATKLGQAHKTADQYLEGVNRVLEESSIAFRDAVVGTLGKVNNDFHKQLAEAVGLLSGTVQELEVTLGSLAPKR